MAANFNSLPLELRREIWKLHATNHGKGRLIECQWIGTPYYQKCTQRWQTLRRPEAAGVRYRHRLREQSRPLATLFVCTESRAEALRHNPNYLQLNRGPKIYFNAKIDYIYFDMLDMLMMHEYCTFLMSRIGYLKVHGFDEILHLARPCPHNFRCLYDLTSVDVLGPMIPNVVDTVYKLRNDRVTNVWLLDFRLVSIFSTLFTTIVNHQQWIKVDDFRWLTTILCNTLFHKIP